MDALLYIAFIAASVALIIIPGPNVLVVVSTSISHGTRRGLQTVLGTSSAMLIQLLIAALGTAWLVESMETGFTWLRWFGVAYLLYLGVKHFVALAKKENTDTITASGSYTRGFFVSLTNPKTLLFFVAFLPQFVSPAGDYTMQMGILSVSFLLLATVLDGLYAIVAGRVRQVIQQRHVNKVQNGASGLLYLAAGAWLAALRKN